MHAMPRELAWMRKLLIRQGRSMTDTIQSGARAGRQGSLSDDVEQPDIRVRRERSRQFRHRLAINGTGGVRLAECEPEPRWTLGRPCRLQCLHGITMVSCIVVPGPRGSSPAQAHGTGAAGHAAA